MKKFILQIDPKVRHGSIMLRIQEVTDQGEQPLRTQALYNLFAIVRRQPNLVKPSIRNLLGLLSPYFSDPSILKRNALMLEIPVLRWESIQKYCWEQGIPIVDLDTGKPIQQLVPVYGNLEMDLEVRRSDTCLSLFLTSENGYRQAWHHVRNALKMVSPSLAEVQDQGYKIQFEVSLSIEFLDRLFLQGPISIPTHKVASYLPSLLQFQYHLLSGPHIHRRIQKGQVQVEIIQDSETQDLVLSIKLHNETLCLKSPGEGMCLYPNLTENRFEVWVWNPEGIHEFLDPLLSILRIDLHGQKGFISLVPDSIQHLRKWIQKVSSTWVDQWIITPHLQKLLQDKEFHIEQRWIPKVQGDWVEYEEDWIVELNGKKVSVTPLKTGSFYAGQAIWTTNDGLILGSINSPCKDRKNSYYEETLFSKSRSRKILPKSLSNDLGYSDSLDNQHKREYELLFFKERDWSFLRTYQKEGVRFLRDRCAQGISCILADEMGLGKTIQILALLSEKLQESSHSKKKTLIICPASVLYVWEQEAKRFFPQLRVFVYTGAILSRKEHLSQHNYDIVVCSYALARQDLSILLKEEWDIVVADEAQMLKNPETSVAQSVKKIGERGIVRIAVTGTPLENRLRDLISILDFLFPGYPGGWESLENYYSQNPQEIPQILSKIMLRRLKQEVAQELPELTEEIIRIELPEDQMRIYLDLWSQAQTAWKRKQKMEVLGLLTRLRQCCCDPRLLDLSWTGHSAKLEATLELVNEIISGGHHVLLFSQFTQMLDLLEKELQRCHIPTLIFTGELSAQQRHRIVQEFQQRKDATVFLMSLRAGGTGLTLTNADYVILYDPWWNPAVEMQAIHRAHRIGQTRRVTVYKLVSFHTIEENVLNLQAKKQELFSTLIHHQTQLTSISMEDLAEILGLSIPD